MKESQIRKHLEICRQRRDMGRIKYGDDEYKTKNMFEEMRQEAYDIINYNLFQIDKIDELEKRFDTMSNL